MGWVAFYLTGKICYVWQKLFVDIPVVCKRVPAPHPPILRHSAMDPACDPFLKFSLPIPSFLFFDFFKSVHIDISSYLTLWDILRFICTKIRINFFMKLWWQKKCQSPHSFKKNCLAPYFHLVFHFPDPSTPRNPQPPSTPRNPQPPSTQFTPSRA